ncbi:MAG: hypothetical protein ACD_24C00159G0002 [uncultured bacterium]|uniref:Methyltransferase type 11 domain-containing protein n=1 Tax=Candidatus Woesebacteria bacterium RIFCSPLOWO2_01_FULL_39_21 TaxID=1802519 RepID=A0A1F8BKU7_9BACT|nr:MAG: hypothetical protein ACD_24C00159G0002 [uncultured bacterium]OGM23212.1 MAG: hypothetical protein A2691_01055 [Candidatus Woesebacteria bacterium RIFCSPHIGHO2_01_FULL_39_23]OGM64289.1 MAG: hypothetical protein A2961_00155 [Candidatus Woesebacteria bacterium RIFCSPLOWO2_01_FULL_39_21]
MDFTIDSALYIIEKILRGTSISIHKIRLSQRKPLKDYKKIKKIKLDLGCGGRKKNGFIGIDVILGPGVDIEQNLENGIPFSDKSVAEIFSSHFLEHLSHQSVPYVIKECHRVLVPHGKLTIEVPDLEACLQKFLSAKEKNRWEWVWEWIFGNQKKDYEFHKTGFTKQRLVSLLTIAGFNNISLTSYKFGSMPSLRVTAIKLV